jgi:DNA repair protein RadA
VAKKSVINPSDVVTDKMESVNEIISLKLEDMDGIGSVRLKKLYSNGIYTVDDLLGYGEESLSRMLDISWDDARKMTMVANESLNSEDVLSSIVISGRDYYNFRKDKIKYSTTGVEELDEITGGFETGVITEFFGAFGSGKTQFMMVACIMAQMPKNPCCLDCGEDCTPEPVSKPSKDYRLWLDQRIVKECISCKSNRIWKGGGMSEYGKQSKVIYIDTENSYRPERLFEIVCNRDLIKTKPQTKTQEKKCETKEPLDDEEYEKAMQFVYNIHISRPRTSALQMLVVANLSSMISGELCKHCQKREITKDSEPTHQNHPKAKDDMRLESHDFEKDITANLVVLDSITGKFRKEFEGRGTLSDRQVKLSSHVRLLESIVESKNIICLVTNQAQEALGVMGDNIRPVGGNVIGHTFTHRIYLKKPQSMSKDKITAILVDSPNKAKNEVVLELGAKGIQEPTV